MIIENFDNGENGTILTSFDLYRILVYEILELDMKDQSVEEFRELIETTFNEHADIPLDSVEGVRFTFAAVGTEFLGLTIENTDLLFEQFMKMVETLEGDRSIESVDNCVYYKYIRKICEWRFTDVKKVGVRKKLR